MLRGHSAVAFTSSVSSGAASSRCLLGLRRRLSPLLSLVTRVDRYNSLLAGAPACLLDGLQSVLNAATGGNMTTSGLFFVMFSTGCQSHSASSTSSVYSSFNHYTELLPSIYEIAALQLIPPRPGYDCDHLSGLIYVCGG